MRTILLEPMRCQFARETADEEQARLQRDIEMESRATEEEAVVAGELKKPPRSDSSNYVTPSSVAILLSVRFFHFQFFF